MNRYPQTHFLLVGDGELRCSLEDLADTLGITLNVHFVGRCNDVQDLFGVMDLFVSSSFRGKAADGNPRKHGGACTRDRNICCGFCLELVKNNETGVLVLPNNPIDLANAICMLLQNPALEIAKSSRRTARSHSFLNQTYCPCP